MKKHLNVNTKNKNANNNEGLESIIDKIHRREEYSKKHKIDDRDKKKGIHKITLRSDRSKY